MNYLQFNFQEFQLLLYRHIPKKFICLKCIAGFVIELFIPPCYTQLDITTFSLDTTQTTPGPSQNMDYITKRCRATTCHECTVSNWKFYYI